jgi:hypothetical protein
MSREAPDFIRLYGLKYGLLIDDSYRHPLNEKLLASCFALKMKNY